MAYPHKGESMRFELNTTDEAINACYPVMRELRPHIDEAEFLVRVREQEKEGYRLVSLYENEIPVAVAGFRINTNLVCGRFLYIDDLVTLPEHRSKGYGAALLNWLRDYAREHQCQQLELDSGLHRLDAHRFYEREKVVKAAYHFAQRL
jgi:GNAT superfamily N-acetyltransferase